MKYTLDAALLQQREEAHKHIKERLELPEYYGGNLDALYDCLSEKSEIEIEIQNADLINNDSYFKKIMPVLEAAGTVVLYQNNSSAAGSQKTPDINIDDNNASPTKYLRVQVPGSKSITNRALLLAALATGKSTLQGLLFSDDSRHFLKCIQDLGFETTVEENKHLITVTGQGGKPPHSKADLYVGSAGTAARFLTAWLGVCEGVYHMDASEQMRRRPMESLLRSLTELGCEVLYDDVTPAEGDVTIVTPNRKGFPFTIKGHGFEKSSISINIDHSSQFLSALLIASCLSERDFTVTTEGSHGMAYIEMTCKMMEQFGVKVQRPDERTFLISAGQSYNPLNYQIEPDVSAACYFYALALLMQVPVLVEGVHFNSLQGDVAFLHILEQMGCHAQDSPEGILLSPPASGHFPGVTVDMSACSDQAITLAAIAPFADSPTHITGIGHIRLQESDRLSAVATELTRMGIRCEEYPDSITIYPGEPKPCRIQTYEDHRMAMGFALTATKVPGIVIDNPDCCAKTFENYFQVLEQTLKQ